MQGTSRKYVVSQQHGMCAGGGEFLPIHCFNAHRSSLTLFCRFPPTLSLAQATCTLSASSTTTSRSDRLLLGLQAFVPQVQAIHPVAVAERSREHRALHMSEGLVVAKTSFAALCVAICSLSRQSRQWVSSTMAFMTVVALLSLRTVAVVAHLRQCASLTYLLHLIVRTGNIEPASPGHQGTWSHDGRSRGGRGRVQLTVSHQDDA